MCIESVDRQLGQYIASNSGRQEGNSEHYRKVGRPWANATEDEKVRREMMFFMLVAWLSLVLTDTESNSVKAPRKIPS